MPDNRLLRKLVVGLISLANFILLAGLFVRAVGAEESDLSHWPDVTTMKLSEDLETWGRLGGVAVDSIGLVYVANFGSEVWRISRSGEVKLLTDSLYGSAGNAIDNNGDLLQASHNNGSLYRISRAGMITPVVEGGLNGPVGVAVDKAGAIFVTNCWEDTVVKIDENGEITKFSEGPMYDCPNGLTFDPSGNLFVVSFDNTIVVKITPDGSATELARLPGIGNSHLAYYKGFLYVTQIHNHRIYRISQDGEYVSIVGDGKPGLEDGHGDQARLAWPNGIAVSAGRLYVNTLDGPRDRGQRGRMQIRSIELPTLFRTLNRTFEDGGVEAMRTGFEQYIAEYATGASEAGIVGGLENSATRFQNRGEFEKALAVAKFTVEKYPESWHAWVSLGDVQATTGDQENAKESFHKALNLEPEEIRILSRIEDLGLR